MATGTHIVKSVRPDSIAAEMEIEPGDEILEINGQKLEDIFDYQYLEENEYIDVLIRKHDSDEEWELEIEKDEDEDLGITFENGLMDDYKSCRNKCVFCFIDQMPPGMRDTLYFKDDDSRLSFLQGNYVTLTNMNDHDIDRIIRYRMSPINVSIQTTNPELRRVMLHNRYAGDIFGKLKRLADAGIELNGQIVLCRGLNDGMELDRTIRDLEQYIPSMRSVSVVPVGLTKFRKGLFPLQPFTKEDARDTLELIHGWQKIFYAKYGIHFVHASDEWYLLAEQPLPEESRYDGYLQLENGVGMLRLLESEVKEDLQKRTGDDRIYRATIATGALAAPFIRQLVAQIHDKYPNVLVNVCAVRNDFFGKRITVSGLITGQDLMRQLEGRDLGKALLIPCNMLRYGEDVFLDDYHVTDVEKRLHTPIAVVDSPGCELVKAVLGESDGLNHKRRQMYEQADRSSGREA